MRRRTLLTRVLIANLLLVSVAVVAAGVSANPNSSFRDDPAVGLILGFAIALTVLVNLFMIQKRFEPLERLIEAMEKADLARSGVDFGGLVDGRAETEEVERLEVAFRRMLERLDAERRRTSSAALQAMEEERARVARDLHDEVNQAMRELLDLARALRPTALDDMGLKAALAGAVKELGHQTSIETSFDSEGDFSDVGSEIQLVAYRVAQESLSNVVRHSGAEHVRVRLRRNGDGLELSVSDDGHGFVLGESDGGLGIPGMRERALLVGGELEVESKPPVGTRIRLRV